jgi:hypothetical protein
MTRSASSILSTGQPSGRRRKRRTPGDRRRASSMGKSWCQKKGKTARPSADAESTPAQDVRGRDGFHNGCGVPNRRHAAPADDTWQVPRSLLAASLSTQRTHTPPPTCARSRIFFKFSAPLPTGRFAGPEDHAVRMTYPRRARASTAPNASSTIAATSFGCRVTRKKRPFGFNRSRARTMNSWAMEPAA